MKRQLKILEILDELCMKKLDKNMMQQHKPLGFTAEEMAVLAGFSRSNISSDLNALHREKLVTKIVSRSTYYVTVKWVEGIYPVLKGKVPEMVRHQRQIEELAANESSQSEKGREITDASHFKNDNVLYNNAENYDSFDGLIGAQDSLKVAVEQAKASVLYPPKGLDTLLVGSTGVGKTLFAEYMYRFACSQGKIVHGRQFIVFNCADYANNPQLLMSQLFGHVRGAFTGADKDKAGLVEKADGGMLFLDEVHRLPPEGQEMLFYLLDRGDFRRMGDTDKIRHVTIRVVAATTENPDSALLKTFLRRIPVVISLPDLASRPLHERFELIKFLLAREAVHIQAKLIVSQEALWALLLYRCQGNIGQLRNDLQLICAKAFLHRGDKNAPVRLAYEELPPKIKQAIVYDPQARLETSKILCTLGSELFIQPNGVAADEEADRSLPKNFYQTISERMQFLKSQGIGQAEIIQCIEMDFENYFQRLGPEQLEISQEYLQSVLPQEFLSVFDLACSLAEKMGKALSRRLYYALAIHIAATVERIRSGLPIVNPNVRSVAEQHPKEYLVAEKMAQCIGDQMGILIPLDEIGFIALMLATFDDRQGREERKVGVLVITHGKSTATSMVDFSNKLLGVTHAKAIDMPLEANVDWVIEKAVQVAKEIDQGKGIVLLVDMGSLSGVAKALTNRTGIMVKSVEMVSTLMVLDVLHKAILPKNDITIVYRSAWTARSMVQREVQANNPTDFMNGKDKAILTTCLTGQGAAAKIKGLLEKLLNQWQLFNIRVIAVEAGNLETLQTRLISLQHSYNIVASVGSIDPQMEDRPHIAIEELIQGGAGSELRRLLTEGLKASDIADRYTDRGMDWEVMRGMVAGMLDEFLTFVNPRKVMDTLMICIRKLEDELQVEFSSSGLVRMLVHSACMVERLLTHAEISYPETTAFIAEHPLEYSVLKKVSNALEEQFSVNVNDEEICHLIEIIKMERRKNNVEEE
ncbi:sigma 54-interacting transcriptional regulator [Pelosinus propionicus]|uniref:Transcriptional regulatory protein LevR, contains PRD, AAA+ and EIIA domains n=1 Tax=Pelosinus propionicus DSM 13327 TaxID=1123291 RepID=A0A1I4NCA2_9FIRM|nr:sigma 54-interacting transcriptional regulator [Pelosinus propionicus]SFM13099.1 Transcriptional regulatory protein LevR, contains PRD, AAA+ and EIIA domains [Pelosinus propionicus DSM 13327]